MILRGTVADLVHSQDVVEIVLASNVSAQHIVAQLDLTNQIIEAEGNLLRISGKAQSYVLARLVEASIPITSLNPLNQTLEEVYVQTTRIADEAASMATTKDGGRA